MMHSFPKKEKLKSKKLIESLFKQGNAITIFPIKLVYLKTTQPSPYTTQTGFSVPKKKIKLAVNRNRIKRLMREAYRLNKPIIFNNSTTSYTLMFLYLGKKEPTFKEVNSIIKALLKKLC